MNEAFNKKQEVWDKKQRACEKVISLVDIYNDKLWNKYKSVCTDIKIYKKRADDEHEKMVECFEESHAAYYAKDGALAKVLSEKGHTYKQKLHQLNRLVQTFCRIRDEAKRIAQKNELPKNIDKLLSMDLKLPQVSWIEDDFNKEFLEALESARRLQNEFNSLHKDFKQKQAIYKSYTQYGDDLALNDMEETSDTWEPYIRGWIEDQAVTVREGKEGTEKEGHTLIANDHISAKEFSGTKNHRGHDHYGPNTYPNIATKRIEDADGNRGKYTGPGSKENT